MKKVLIFLFEGILSEFKLYRKKKGGEWRLIRDQDMSGMATSEYWTQDKPDTDAAVLKTEKY
jgi:hypothetical protein